MHAPPAVGPAGLRRPLRWALAAVLTGAVCVAGQSAWAADVVAAPAEAVTAAPAQVSTTVPTAPTPASQPRNDDEIPGTPSRRTSAIAAVAAALSIAVGGLVFRHLVRRDASEGRTVVAVPSAAAGTTPDPGATNGADGTGGAPERAG